MASKPLIAGVVVAVLLLASSLALKMAEHAGMIDAGMSARLFQVMMGLMVAYYGNAIPKQIGRSRGIEADRRIQKFLRAGGWSFTLAGLAYAVLAFLAPPDSLVPMLVMATAVAIGLGLMLRCAFIRRRAPSSL